MQRAGILGRLGYPVNLHLLNGPFRSLCTETTSAPITGATDQLITKEPIPPPPIELPKNRVLVLAGPTGVGKTDISIRLAKRLNGEIISADSVQLHRRLNIGSDKIHPESRQGIKHHGIDIIDPGEPFSSGHFHEMAREATEDIISRGKVPIVVGGSSFYIRTYIRGKPTTPPSTPEASAYIDRQFEEDGHDWEKSFQRLVDIDPVAANKMQTNMWKRLKRALEVHHITGRILSSYAMPEGDGKYDFRCVFLSATRLELNRKIDLRCEKTVRRGLVEEFIDLRSKYQKEISEYIGYKEANRYLDTVWPYRKEWTRHERHKGLKTFLAEYAQATRKFAHRQYQWYRNEPEFYWIDASKSGLDERVLDYVQTDEKEMYRLLTEAQEVREAHNTHTVEDLYSYKVYQMSYKIFDKELARNDFFRSIGKKLDDTKTVLPEPIKRVFEDDEPASDMVILPFKKFGSDGRRTDPIPELIPESNGSVVFPPNVNDNSVLKLSTTKNKILNSLPNQKTDLIPESNENPQLNTTANDNVLIEDKEDKYQVVA